MRIEDAESARYAVIVEHSEYEKTVLYFVSLDKAKEQVNYWQERHAEVYLTQLINDSKPMPQWSDCVRAANRLADLVCLMYHPKDEKARKTWPTATWSELIASEVGVEVPETR